MSSRITRISFLRSLFSGLSLALSATQVAYAQKTESVSDEMLGEQHAPIEEFDIGENDEEIFCDDPQIVRLLIDFKFPRFKEDFPTFDLNDRGPRLEQIMGSTAGFTASEITAYKKLSHEGSKLRFQIDHYMVEVTREFDEKRREYNELNEKSIKTEQNLRRSRRRFNPADRLNLDELNKREAEVRRERDALAKRLRTLRECKTRPLPPNYRFETKSDPAVY